MFKIRRSERYNLPRFTTWKSTQVGHQTKSLPTLLDAGKRGAGGEVGMSQRLQKCDFPDAIASFILVLINALLMNVF